MTLDKAKTIYLVACEASGDTHGAHLAEKLLATHPNIQLRGVGGKLMKEAGVAIDFDMTTISALGFGDVIRNYSKYKKILEGTAQIIKKTKPDAVVCIDSPAFNLRLAKKISSITKVIYFISPQLWAWGERRVKVVREHIDLMLAILPFEVEFYKKHGVKAEFIGHPIMEKIPHPKHSKIENSSQKTIGLFPGSREKEIRRILPVMLQSAEIISSKIPSARFIMKRSENISHSVYDEVLAESKLSIECPDLSFYELVQSVDFALVTSGTATLETALLGTPFLLIYKTGFSTYFLGKHLIKVPYLGLANLLLDKPVIPEFIQNNAIPEDIAKEALTYLNNQEKSTSMREEFSKLREILGSKNAAEMQPKLS